MTNSELTPEEIQADMTFRLQEDTSTLLSEGRIRHGIELSDKELRQIMTNRKEWTHDEWLSTVSGEINRRATKQSKRSNIGAGAIAGSSGRPAGGFSKDDMIDELSKLQKHPVQNWDRIKVLQKKLGW